MVVTAMGTSVELGQGFSACSVSALPQIADIDWLFRNVRFVPRADMRSCRSRGTHQGLSGDAATRQCTFLTGSHRRARSNLLRAPPSSSLRQR